MRITSCNRSPVFKGSNEQQKPQTTNDNDYNKLANWLKYPDSNLNCITVNDEKPYENLNGDINKDIITLDDNAVRNQVKGNMVNLFGNAQCNKVTATDAVFLCNKATVFKDINAGNIVYLTGDVEANNITVGKEGECSVPPKVILTTESDGQSNKDYMPTVKGKIIFPFARGEVNCISSKALRPLLKDQIENADWKFPYSDKPELQYTTLHCLKQLEPRDLISLSAKEKNEIQKNDNIILSGSKCVDQIEAKTSVKLTDNAQVTDNIIAGSFVHLKGKVFVNNITVGSKECVQPKVIIEEECNNSKFYTPTIMGKIQFPYQKGLVGAISRRPYSPLKSSRISNAIYSYPLMKVTGIYGQDSLKYETVDCPSPSQIGSVKE